MVGKKQTPVLGPRLISTHEAAKYLDISYHTLLDYIERGLLPYVALPKNKKEGTGDRRARHLDIRDLDRFIEQQKKCGSPDAEIGTAVGTIGPEIACQSAPETGTRPVGKDWYDKYLQRSKK